jgi:translation initiation factor 1A
MPRKNKGGKSSKRRGGGGGGSNARERTRIANPDEPSEMYAVVETLYGHGNCGVLCNDGTKRMCVIRNKFRGRKQSGNRVSVGTRVLVGLREWEVTSAAKQDKCDLLYVYDDCEVGNLRVDKTVNWNIMKGRGEEKTVDGNEADLFDFVLDEELGADRSGEKVDDEILRRAVGSVPVSEVDDDYIEGI